MKSERKSNKEQEMKKEEMKKEEMKEKEMKEKEIKEMKEMKEMKKEEIKEKEMKKETKEFQEWIGKTYTPDIKVVVEEAQLLVSYIAHEGDFKIQQELLEVFVHSKHLIQQNQWNKEQERDFWVAYDKVAHQIKPVTIESLRATMPRIFFNLDNPQEGKNKNTFRKTKSYSAVLRYRILASLSLMALLFFQIYWLIGENLNNNLHRIFEQRGQHRTEISKLKNPVSQEISLRIENVQKLEELERREKILNQELDANYELLRSWNRVWQAFLFLEQYTSKVTEYTQFKHDRIIEKFQGDLVAKEKEILSFALEKARNRFYLTRLSADFVLDALSTYFLPLLYGLLGAITYILRSLSVEIRNLTYSSNSEIRYRLRLSLGALSGMAMGWFFKPSDLPGVTSSLSPLTIAFIVGYNIEILFSLMDKAIDAISKALHPPKKPEKT